MAIPTGSLNARVLGVLAVTAVWFLALAIPVAAAPPDSGGGVTGAKVSAPVTEPEGFFSIPVNVYLTGLVLACAILALAAYRRYHRTAVTSG